MILQVDFYFLLRWQGFDHRSNFEAADFEVGDKDLEYDFLLCVVSEGGGGVGDFADLQSTEVDFVAGEGEVRSNNFAAEVDVYLAGSNLSRDDFAPDIILLAIALAVL